MKRPAYPSSCGVRCRVLRRSSMCHCRHRSSFGAISSRSFWRNGKEYGDCLPRFLRNSSHRSRSDQCAQGVAIYQARSRLRAGRSRVSADTGSIAACRRAGGCRDRGAERSGISINGGPGGGRTYQARLGESFASLAHRSWYAGRDSPGDGAALEGSQRSRHYHGNSRQCAGDRGSSQRTSSRWLLIW